MVNYNTLQLTPTHCLDNYSRSATKTTLYYSVKRLSEIIFSILGVKQFPLPKCQLPSARKSYQAFASLHEAVTWQAAVSWANPKR